MIMNVVFAEENAVIDAEFGEVYTIGGGYDKGFADGEKVGYEEGYQDGYTEGKSKGYGEGYDVGHAEGYTRGHEDGWSSGLTAGEETARKTFWDKFQNNGRRNGYRFAFYDWYWSDVNYNPVYAIVCSAVSTDMMRYAQITDTKVDINFTHVGSSAVFANNSYLKTIRKLIVTENVTFSNWFAQCTALENVTFEGTIGQNIDFSACPLTKSSLLNIIEHLGKVSTTKTLTIGTTNKGKLTTTEIAVATQKGWTVA